VQRVGVLGLDELELGVGELQAAVRVSLEPAVQDQMIAGVELVLQKRRVEPRHSGRPARIANQRFEDAEPRAARRAQPALDDLPADRDRLPFAQ
jgi:hypothetical protein